MDDRVEEDVNMTLRKRTSGKSGKLNKLDKLDKYSKHDKQGKYYKPYQVMTLCRKNHPMEDSETGKFQNELLVKLFFFHLTTTSDFIQQSH